jgi:hypothetical protein
MMKTILKWVWISLLTAGVLCAFSCPAQEELPVRSSGGEWIEASDVKEADYPRFTRWLDRSAQSPVSYIVKKCREHQTVIIGEQHNQKEYCELFIQTIPEVYHRAGVRVVALEVCNSEDNGKLARLIGGDAYDKNLAAEIARSHNWGLWGYKEYWDIFEAVWTLNRSLPPGAEPMRVVGIDKEMDYQLDAMWRDKSLKDPALIKKAEGQPDIYKRDDWLVANTEKEILDKGAKGIMLVGFHHSFTHYAQPVLSRTDRTLEREWPRMANILYQKYGDKVFQIAVHGPHSSPALIDSSYKGEEPVFANLMEAIQAAHGNKPVGFDVVGSPFADIRDARSYYFHWQPKVRFADICTGFIFLKPYKGLAPCTWMDDYVTDEMFEKSKAFYEHSYSKKFLNSKEVNEFFKSGQGSI